MQLVIICTEPVWAENVTTDIYPGGEHDHAPPGAETLNPCAWLENPSTHFWIMVVEEGEEMPCGLTCMVVAKQDSLGI